MYIEQRILKATETRKNKGKFYNLYNINSGLIKENISLNDLKKMFQKLHLFDSPDNYYGKSIISKNRLIKKGKENLIGMYSIEID
jgi:hypothetical protein